MPLIIHVDYTPTSNPLIKADWEIRIAENRDPHVHPLYAAFRVLECVYL
jgi:hypothetical protein